MVNECLRALWEEDRIEEYKTEKERLRFMLTPTSFEQLCVDLLNLSSEDELLSAGALGLPKKSSLPNEQTCWVHVGGAGDGGVDGAGFHDRSLSMVLQCKYQRTKSPSQMHSDMAGLPSEVKRIYYATLWDDEPKQTSIRKSGKSKSWDSMPKEPQNEFVWLNSDVIERLCVAHMQDLPLYRRQPGLRLPT